MDISLDGFVGAADRDVEGWMLPSLDDESMARIAGMLDHTGTHVMGRVA